MRKALDKESDIKRRREKIERKIEKQRCEEKWELDKGKRKRDKKEEKERKKDEESIFSLALTNFYSIAFDNVLLFSV